MKVKQKCLFNNGDLYDCYVFEVFNNSDLYDCYVFEDKFSQLPKYPSDWLLQYFITEDFLNQLNKSWNKMSHTTVTIDVDYQLVQKFKFLILKKIDGSII